jgi:hypothetical protein
LALEYEPQPRQQLLHATKARQILYGGSAGGGKSKALRFDAYDFCINNPGCQAYLFRRTLGELDDNHIKWARFEVPLDIGKYNETRKVLEFINGSILHFCYCEKESDVLRYQGSEQYWTGIDEAAHLTESQIGYLKTRNRLGGWTPARDTERLPRFVMASNPGGPGHNFLKETFLDRCPPETYFYDGSMVDPGKPDDKGWLSVFIPARMSDNKHLDEDYAASFGGLSPEQARALREGDWDAVVGQALHNLNKDSHQIRPFSPPLHWTKFMVIDWGTASPFSVGWYCVSEGAILARKEKWPEIWLPSGALIRYNEYYGWNGKPNKGCRLPPKAVGKKIIEIETDRKETMDYRVGDTEMWAIRGGPSVHEHFTDADPRLVMQKSEKDRKRNYTEVLARLAGNSEYMEDGEVLDDPMFFITQNCRHFWRTVPTLTLDTTDAEKGPATTNTEDHVYDEVAYACRSRPYVSTKRDRFEEEHGDEMRKAAGQIDDPYATA